jgi:GNAT superfamily N-acetyltransferase
MSTPDAFDLRLATFADCDAIRALMVVSIRELQKGYLTPDQIEASFAGMGLDTQLIEDGTYFTIWDNVTLVGCGGWSNRATKHGGDHSPGRDLRLLNPLTERARIRAMYTRPDYIRRGIGRMIIEAAEAAAFAKGFRSLEMVATRAGQPFYQRCGYIVESEWLDRSGATPVPVATMIKTIADEAI